MPHSGWRLTAGHETFEYMDDSDNWSYVSLGAVLRAVDRCSIPYLNVKQVLLLLIR